MRRIYTHEGEFYRLSREAAQARLRRHRTVPAQWLAVARLRRPGLADERGHAPGLRETPLSYTSDPQHLYQLPDFTAINAPGLVWSARSAWRRGLSKIVSEQREQLATPR
jgi:predicted deacetylase